MVKPIGVVLGLAAVAGGLLLTIPGAAATNSECEAVNGTLTSTANLNNLTTQGTISGDLEGATFFQGDGTSLTLVTATNSPPLRPTVHYTGDLSLTTHKGVLKTRSVGVFEPGGNGLGTQFDRVLGDQSTGQFAGATGHLYFNFQTDSTGTIFTNTYAGEICS
jgi:hypothetical protein